MTKPNHITEYQQKHHVESMREDWIADRWREFENVNYGADMHRLLEKCRKAGVYWLADEFKKQWNQSIKEGREVEREYQESQGWPIHLSINNGF